MDYEKLHKDTINKLQQMVNSGKITVEIARGICADFVPESEDEKIREHVVYAINQLHVCECTKNKLIAWVKKQGEQKLADLPKGEDYGIDGLYAAIDILQKTLGEVEGYQTDDGILEHQCAISAVKELSKQKPVIEMKTPEESLGISSEEYDKIVDECIYGEQKHTDKVEPKFHVGDMVKRKDNPHLAYILKRLTDDGDYEFRAIGKDGHEGCTCFATVKYQDEWELIEQNPAWSEEDKAVLDALIRRLEGEDVHISPHLAVKCLKSLKERYTWKPTGAQLASLEIACDRNDRVGFDLTQLLKELKKLREE